VKLGLGLPQSGKMNLNTDVVRVAKAAEEAGFTSLWAFERTLVPVDPTQGLYNVPGLPWPRWYRHVADGLTVLTAAAAVTSRVRLGTSVLVAPLHVPTELARTLATLDLISGGRVIAGLGSGWSIDEYNAAGADIDGRGRALDETIDVCEAIWGADPVSVKGQRTLIDNATVGPKPDRRIPIMLGGGWGPRAVDRIARRADGWLAAGTPGPALKASWDQIREAAAAHGRDADALEMIPRANIELTDAPLGADRQPFQGSMDQVIDDLVGNAEAGADELLIELQPSVRDGSELLDRALEVKERLAAAGV
jgi:probable F420-dependent oxidoreductase